MPDYTLYCGECQHPIPSGYCSFCKFIPSLQDTYLSTPEIEASAKAKSTAKPQMRTATEKYRFSVKEFQLWLKLWSITDPTKFYDVTVLIENGICTSMTVDLVWTQEELREHLSKLGMSPENYKGEDIPQCVKYIAAPQPPVTAHDIQRAKEIIKELEQKNENKL